MNSQIEAETASSPIDLVRIAAIGPRRRVAKPTQAINAPILFLKRPCSEVTKFLSQRMTKPLLAILLLLPMSVSAGIVIWKREVPVGIRR